MVSQIN